MLQDILKVAKENPNTPLSSTFLSKETGISARTITKSLKSFARKKEYNPRIYPGFKIYFDPVGRGRFEIIFTGDGY